MEPLLAQSIQENLGLPCRSDDTVRELTRGIRQHFTKFVKPLASGLFEQAQLGLGHSYSRSKVKNISFPYCLNAFPMMNDIAMILMNFHKYLPSL